MKAARLLGCYAIAAMLLEFSTGIVGAEEGQNPFGVGSKGMSQATRACCCLGQSGEAVAKIQ